MSAGEGSQDSDMYNISDNDDTNINDRRASQSRSQRSRASRSRTLKEMPDDDYGYGYDEVSDASSNGKKRARDRQSRVRQRLPTSSALETSMGAIGDASIFSTAKPRIQTVGNNISELEKQADVSMTARTGLSRRNTLDVSTASFAEPQGAEVMPSRQPTRSLEEALLKNATETLENQDDQSKARPVPASSEKKTSNSTDKPVSRQNSLKAENKSKKEKGGASQLSRTATQPTKKLVEDGKQLSRTTTSVNKGDTKSETVRRAATSTGSSLEAALNNTKSFEKQNLGAQLVVGADVDSQAPKKSTKPNTMADSSEEPLKRQTSTGAVTKTAETTDKPKSVLDVPSDLKKTTTAKLSEPEPSLKESRTLKNAGNIENLNDNQSILTNSGLAGSGVLTNTVVNSSEAPPKKPKTTQQSQQPPLSPRRNVGLEEPSMRSTTQRSILSPAEEKVEKTDGQGSPRMSAGVLATASGLQPGNVLGPADGCEGPFYKASVGAEDFSVDPNFTPRDLKQFLEKFQKHFQVQIKDIKGFNFNTIIPQDISSAQDMFLKSQREYEILYNKHLVTTKAIDQVKLFFEYRGLNFDEKEPESSLKHLKEQLMAETVAAERYSGHDELLNTQDLEQHSKMHILEEYKRVRQYYRMKLHALQSELDVSMNTIQELRLNNKKLKAQLQDEEYKVLGLKHRTKAFTKAAPTKPNVGKDPYGFDELRKQSHMLLRKAERLGYK